MSGRALPSAAAWLLLMLALHAAQADHIAATVTTPGALTGGSFSTFGWSFRPAVNVVVSQLGVLDLDSAAPGFDGDGLEEAHAVGLWTTGGTLLVSATVPAGTAAPLVGGTRFVDISDTLLSGGQTYIIGAYYLDGADTLQVDGFNGSVLAYDPIIAPVAGRFGNNQFSGLAFPGTSATGVRLGPNFTFTLPLGTTRTWPTDPAPCNDISDLVACINGANHGDVIEIAANSIPSQFVSVAAAKSFTLRPATSFTPVFGDFTNFYVPGGTLDVTVVIEGLTLARGIFQADGGSGVLDLTLRNNVIEATVTSGNGIAVSGGSGPTVFDIANNQISINVGPAVNTSAISISGGGAGNAGRISGNRIVQVGGGQSGAVNIYNSDGALNVDVIGNQISGSDFNYGVGIFAEGAGDVTARIINNTISGQVNAAGGPAAIALYVSEGSADFQVLNNTVAFNETGIGFGGRPDLGATATALISNNIVAFNTGAGMNLHEFADTTINDFNLVHGNDHDDFTPGPGTLTADPLFINPGDLRLQAGSPALNSGSNSRVPADITTDVVGNPRIQGIVDRGAFELAAGGSDVDGDGIADGLDNCTLVRNANQRDTNGDGYGNLCDADLNNIDGLVNFPDLAVFRAAFGTVNADADFDGNGGIVNFADLALFRSLFGKAPGPSGLVP